MVNIKITYIALCGKITDEMKVFCKKLDNFVFLLIVVKYVWHIELFYLFLQSRTLIVLIVELLMPIELVTKVYLFL